MLDSEPKAEVPQKTVEAALPDRQRLKIQNISI